MGQEFKSMPKKSLQGIDGEAMQAQQHRTWLFACENEVNMSDI